jgi:hypothetical protein
MKRLLFAGAVGALLVGAAPAEAKKQKLPPTSGSAQKGKDKEKPPRPDDRGINEGAQGRRNATEDADRAAESNTYDRRLP